MLNSLKTKVEKATIRTKTGGQGIFVPDGLILTAAHCIHWNHEGGMVLGDHYVQEIEANGQDLKVGPLAVEPVSDLAVLGALDDQVFPDEMMAYDTFYASVEPIDLCLDDFDLFVPFPVYVLTHKRFWVPASAKLCKPAGHMIWVDADAQIEGGTSGGPVITEGGLLLGVVSHFSETGGQCSGLIPRPHLAAPNWLVQRMCNS